MFSDYVNNVDPMDAEDLRFFIRNMCVPVDIPQEFALEQLQMMSTNKAMHPHLRWRATNGLNIARVFGNDNRKVASAYVKLNGRTNTVRTVHYNPAEYLDVPAIIPAVDHIISDLCGQIIFPQNPETLAGALKILHANPATNEKFTRFRDLIMTALEDNYEATIIEIIDTLENWDSLARGLRAAPRPKNEFYNKPSNNSNIVSITT